MPKALFIDLIIFWSNDRFGFIGIHCGGSHNLFKHKFYHFLPPRKKTGWHHSYTFVGWIIYKMSTMHHETVVSWFSLIVSWHETIISNPGRTNFANPQDILITLSTKRQLERHRLLMATLFHTNRQNDYIYICTQNKYAINTNRNHIWKIHKKHHYTLNIIHIWIKITAFDTNYVYSLRDNESMHGILKSTTKTTTKSDLATAFTI